MDTKATGTNKKRNVNLYTKIRILCMCKIHRAFSSPSPPKGSTNFGPLRIKMKSKRPKDGAPQNTKQNNTFFSRD